MANDEWPDRNDNLKKEKEIVKKTFLEIKEYKNKKEVVY